MFTKLNPRNVCFDNYDTFWLLHIWFTSPGHFKSAMIVFHDSCHIQAGKLHLCGSIYLSIKSATLDQLLLRSLSSSFHRPKAEKRPLLDKTPQLFSVLLLHFLSNRNMLLTVFISKGNIEEAQRQCYKMFASVNYSVQFT